jgi:chromosome partitioning protein
MITVIGNMKGGTGKSTIAFNLAVWLAHDNKSLSLFDFDPQQTFSDVVDIRAEEGYQPVLPKTKDKKSIAKIKSLSTDHIIIDVSMSDQVAMKKAIQICDQIIIPVAPSQADIWSTQRFIKLIKNERTKMPKVFGVVNRADTHPFVIETKETEQALDSLPVIDRIPIRLHNRTAYRRSFSEGLGVFEMEPNSKASIEFIKASGTLFS